MGEQAAALRRIIEEPGLVPLVGAYDVLSARLAEQSGFPAIHVGGYNLSASRLGMPDVGFLTMAENLDALRAITGRVSIPVLADGDDGYGNHLNVTRLVRELERAGVAGVHIEDQVFPKRCGHMEGKRVVSRADMVAKIAAAVDARRDADFVVVARTDAAAVTGFDDALERAAAYAEAGADVLFVEAPEQEEQVATIARRIGKPLIYNWCFGGKSPDVAPARLSAMGFKFLLLTDVLFAVAHTLRDLYAEVRHTGTYAGFAPRMVPFAEFNRIVGMGEVEALDQRYGR
ncbi:MAG: isocitrate lyase/PEP mutase family protein [Alphaproteobacteria bacterium]|nr:isocitrate lyase/PEP mutase family protein [Alphaproteobacteria bacterium]